MPRIAGAVVVGGGFALRGVLVPLVAAALVLCENVGTHIVGFKMARDVAVTMLECVEILDMLVDWITQIPYSFTLPRNSSSLTEARRVGVRDGEMCSFAWTAAGGPNIGLLVPRMSAESCKL